MTSQMISPLNQAILELLAMTIFADKKIHSDEIRAFVDAVRTLEAKAILSGVASEASTILWYEQNKERLMDQLRLPNFEIWLEATLDHFRGLSHRQDILDAIDAIAQADGELHASERALHRLVASA